MDLSERKYILLEPEKNTEKTISNNSDYNYYVTLKVNVDEVNLNEYEKYVIEYIFESTKISEKTTRIDLNKRFKEIGKSYSNSMNYYKKMQSLKNECINRFYDKVPSKIQRIGILQMVVVLLLLIINTAFISPLTIMTRISLGIVVVIAACFYYGILLTSISSTRILKDSIIEEYNKINGLKKYLTDYSVIKERYPIEIKLWGKYLVFATIFGIADKVQKEFKEELIKQGYNEETINTNYTSLIIASHCSEFYKMTIISTGSSSSGGYSGGGSGGGGGGGGRRRRILKT